MIEIIKCILFFLVLMCNEFLVDIVIDDKLIVFSSGGIFYSVDKVRMFSSGWSLYIVYDDLWI